MKWFYNSIQLAGGAILSAGYVPQIAQIIRTGYTRDLNLPFWISVVTGIACMEVYAIHLVRQKTGHAFLVTNTLSLVLSATILTLKVMFG